MKNNYYTYAYLREDGTPYYIGKGKGNRAFYGKRQGFRAPKDRTRILILKKNLTEEEALRHEIYMIAVYGRKDLGTGILWNFTDGGEGTSGRVVSEETKQKQSQAMRGRKPWCAGKKIPHRKKVIPSNARPVRGTSPDGEVQVWESASKAAQDLGLSNSGISRCARGERTTYNDWNWSYLD
jgi:hypothetical protein